MSNTWICISNSPATTCGFEPETMILLTDGSVLVHNGAHGCTHQWYRLAPDSRGRYEFGNWNGPFEMVNQRLFFASGVLKDGRVFVVGGEYSDDKNASIDDLNIPDKNWTPLGEIFDPTTNTWSPMEKPSEFDWINGDAPSCVLPDGKVIFGSLSERDTAIWDPGTGEWSKAGPKPERSNEETWALLPDGTVLAVEIWNANKKSTSRYSQSTDKWISAGDTPSELPRDAEMGPMLMMPNGRLFAIGASGHTAIYVPPTDDPTRKGSWTIGPDMPLDNSAYHLSTILTCKEAPACVMPNGKVLCVAGSLVPDEKGSGGDSIPTTFFVFDPDKPEVMYPQIPQPPNNERGTMYGRLLLLPTGQVLFSSQEKSISLLSVDSEWGLPRAVWRPKITAVETKMRRGQSYVVSGKQLNGLTQACSFGDDAQMATNYPLVRLTRANSSQVMYLRTKNFSTMGIATGDKIVAAEIEVPLNTPSGQWALQVVANGIASCPFLVEIM